MGGLGSGPSLKMRGFQSGPSREKQGILELKITKKRILFLNEGLFDLPTLEKRYKELYTFESGSFRVAQVEKVEAHTRTVLIWEYLPPSPLPVAFISNIIPYFDEIMQL